MAKEKAERKSDKAAAEDTRRARGAAASADAEPYEFPMPKFDEKAFMRREVESARMSFIAVGLGVLAGVLARLADYATGNFLTGWIPILALLVGLTPLFRRLGYSEENTTPKSMFGNWSLLFFTGLALWVVLYNPPFDGLLPR